MSRQHRSSKLLNKATESSGKLTLFTELNHTFLPNDYVYISGGYYDNTTENVYASNWLASGSIFSAAANKAYKVLSVNIALNSITLDYDVSSTPLFPYCDKAVTTNVYGDPTDLTDPAYAYDDVANDGDFLYKHVYISQMFNGNTRVQKGTINNGIFGTDLTEIHVGQKISDGGNSIYKNNLTINHICAKKVSMDYGTMDSKSSNVETSNKLAVNIYNSYNTYNVIVGNNNDGQGYSYFQNIRIGSVFSNTYADIELKFGKIGNGGHYSNTGAKICKALVTGASLGYEGLSKLNSTVVENCKVINASSLNNVKLEVASGTNILEDSSYNSGLVIHLNSVNSIVFDGTDTITFDGFTTGDLANGKLEFSPTKVFYLTGIKDSALNDHIDYLNSECRINSFSFTYGVLNDGIISITFLDLAANSADFIANFTTGPGPSPGTYYVDGLNLGYLHLCQTGVDNDHAITNVNLPYIYAYTQTLNLIGVVVPDAITPGRVKLVSNGYYHINIFGGYFKNIDAINEVIIYGYLTKVLVDMYQLALESQNSITYENCVFKPDTSSGLVKRNYAGIFIDSLISNGNFSNSEFYNTRIVPFGTDSTIFLYNSRVLTTSYVHEDVEWEYINFNPTRVLYSQIGSYYYKNKHGYFQGRISSFVVGNTDQININHSALTINDYAWNLNNSKTRSAPFYATAALAPNYTGFEYRDTVANVINNYSTDPTHSIIIDASVKSVPNINPFQSTDTILGIGSVGSFPSNTTIAFFNLGTFSYTVGTPNRYIPLRNKNYLIAAEDYTTNTNLASAIADIGPNYAQDGTGSTGTNGSGAIDSDLTLSGTHPFTVRAGSIFTKDNFYKYKNTPVLAERTETMIWAGVNMSPYAANNFSEYLDINFHAEGDNTSTLYSLTANGTTVIDETTNGEGSYTFVFDQDCWYDMMFGTQADTVTPAYIEIESVITEKCDAVNGNIIGSPSVRTYRNDPSTCCPITERLVSNLSNFTYDGRIPFATNASLVALKPDIDRLHLVPGEFYKITVNLAVYMYNLIGYTGHYENCGKYEIRQTYLWIEVI